MAIIYRIRKKKLKNRRNRIIDILFWLKTGITIIITLTAVVQDLKCYKVSNQLTAVGFTAAILTIVVKVFKGGDVTEEFVGGIGVFIVLFGIYLLGGIGAGDVKLLTVIGFLLGDTIFRIAAAAFVVAAVFGTAGLMFDRLEKKTVRVLEGYTANLHIMHFSVAILIGELIALCMCIV